jgi:AcrR family transcriptional regulator
MRAEPNPPLGSAVEGASSHDRILAAGKSLFAAKGYENTSTVAIARMAGTSESQLMKHFGNKEGLLEAIFDQGWARMGGMFEQLRQEPSPARKLRRLVELIMGGLEQDPELKELMLLEGRRIRKEGNMVVLTRGFLTLVGVIDAVLGEMKATGELRPEADPQAVRSALMGMIEGLMRDQILARRVTYPAQYSREDMWRTFEMALGGFLRK